MLLNNDHRDIQKTIYLLNEALVLRETLRYGDWLN